ncbi:Transformation system protein [hydrothermal vent metagenome]|uniref:Transformation system protein n=1 Tax=hydrothermal vent metagenome TaxID=652676 RepID=A0A1W1E7A1_9ZZZZ
MYDIKELEKQWEHYHRKRIRPWIILALFISALVAMLFIFKDKVNVTALLPTGTKEEIEKSDTKQPKPIDKIYLSPSLERLEVKQQRSLVESPIENVNEHTVSRKNALHIEVIETQKSTDAYKEVEKRFRLGHDPDDSLFLAKAYYLKGMYKKAEYWALQTNKIDENIEESWLIFVKAKLKRGHRNEALRILNTYIEKTNSIEGKVLLSKIRKGNI